jgi:hypothetical protein
LRGKSKSKRATAEKAKPLLSAQWDKFDDLMCRVVRVKPPRQWNYPKPRKK